MALVYDQDLNTSGKVQSIAPGLLVVSVTIRNNTTAIITLTDNRGQTYTTQPGSNHTFDISPSTQFTYQSSFSASGGAQIVYSDAPLPNETTSQTIPPGTVPVSGSVTILNDTVTVGGNIVVSGAVSITNASIAVTGSVAILGGVAITGSVTILNASIAVTGTVAITGVVNIGTISGGVTINSGTVNVQNVVGGVLLTVGPDALVRASVLNNSTDSYVTARRTSILIVQALINTIARTGHLTVSVTDPNGRVHNFLANIPIPTVTHGYRNALAVLPWVFRRDIPSGSTINVTHTGSLTVVTGY